MRIISQSFNITRLKQSLMHGILLSEIVPEYLVIPGNPVAPYSGEVLIYLNSERLKGHYKRLTGDLSIKTGILAGITQGAFGAGRNRLFCNLNISVKIIGWHDFLPG